MDREGSIKLLSAILANQPHLPGAACRGQHELFDPIRGRGPRFQRQEQIRLAEAAQVCAGCPAIRPCQSVTVFAELKEPA